MTHTTDEKKKALTVQTNGTRFVVDDLERPGSPYVGRGSNIREAIGDYILNNQNEFDFIIDNVSDN